MTVIKLFRTGCRSVSSRGFKDQKTNPGSGGGGGLGPFFSTKIGRAARISRGFRFLIKFLMVLQFLIDYNAPLN